MLVWAAGLPAANLLIPIVPPLPLATLRLALGAAVLLPLWWAGRAPYVLGGVSVTAVLAATVLGLLGSLGLRGRVGATLLGVLLGLGLVAATRLIAPHPRAAANLAYIERVWEPAASATSVVLAPRER